MLIPSGFTFLLQPLTFQGYNCQPNIMVQLDGRIIAPSKKSDWDKLDFQWILFVGLHSGITIRGKGIIDGFGNSWWDHKDSDGDNRARPHAIRIADSINVIVMGITIQNSPYFHFYIDDCQIVQILNFTALSPADSPNTDGIHLSYAQHVLIYNSTLACGDDCVSILNGCSDVKIQNVNCGPGHGYSIGGLGAPGLGEADVKDIIVINSRVQNSLTGVRIKTWPGGIGSVRNITFINITMSNVKTAISIDQNYCGGPKVCPEPDKNAVAISDIMYEGITGTYTKTSVSLVCSKYKVCRNLRFGNINLTPSNSFVPGGYSGTFCANAYGKLLSKTTPPLDRCILPDKQAPLDAPAPAEAQAPVAM
ncbi:Polygalacturonase [Handroanthus impetiginosus]|uniref:Polygalacturonase n=1 Tax=Handroanthus impetiginosus TaxID=429701 RepID=A0A2G9GRP5_9LAMI|nr:Polygalacturonase [Handroanthus impetiginosus]